MAKGFDRSLTLQYYGNKVYKHSLFINTRIGYLLLHPSTDNKGKSMP